MLKLNTYRKLTIIMSLMMPLSSYATLITQAPASPSLINLNFDEHPNQEVNLGPVTLTASNGSAVLFNATNSFGSAGFSGLLYGLGQNGVWTNSSNTFNQGSSYAWVNGGDAGGINSTMRFKFESGPVSMVGGFMNYVLIDGNPYNDPSLFSIKALDQKGSVIESITLEDAAPIRTIGSMNTGEFRGISHNIADIYSFEIQGAGVIKNLQFTSNLSPVPEPKTLSLFVLGLLLITSSKIRTNLKTVKYYR